MLWVLGWVYFGVEQSELPQPSHSSSGYVVTAVSDVTAMQWNKQLLSSPAFTKENVPQYAPILETPVQCCWGYSRAKQFFLGYA